MIISVLQCLFLLSLTSADEVNSRNPFGQYLPDCRLPYPIITKKTTNKALACPMIRDEQGFLAEWVGYHQMHGFDHIIIFDHGSIDNYAAEIQRWITSGYVTVYKHEDWPSILGEDVFATVKQHTRKFDQIMTFKSLLENFCKQQAINWGYHYYVSLDLDEYLMPIAENITAVDALDKYFDKTNRKIYNIGKHNFQQTPHTLEPVNLLTIEAYMNRMPGSGVMTYFKNVASKLAILLQHDSYNQTITDYLARCCHFHACTRKSVFCNDQRQDVTLIQTMNKGAFVETLVINHYSRSLEKYALKAATWETAGNKDNVYHIEGFLERNLGHAIDRRMMRYTCQLRQHLIDHTGQRPFFRSGNYWYRNVEFGLPMLNAEKGRVNDVAAEKGFRYDGVVPDHYFGYYTTLYEYSEQFGTNIPHRKPHNKSRTRMKNAFEHTAAIV